MPGSSDGRQITAAAVIRLIRQNREGDRLKRLAVPAKILEPADGNRGEHTSQMVHEGGILCASSSDNDFLNVLRDPSARARHRFSREPGAGGQQILG